jgi:hypothetical protein
MRVIVCILFSFRATDVTYGFVTDTVMLPVLCANGSMTTVYVPSAGSVACARLKLAAGVGALKEAVLEKTVRNHMRTSSTSWASGRARRRSSSRAITGSVESRPRIEKLRLPHDRF